MKGICRLYETEEELMESHIFPKFAIDYFKKTGSKYSRNFVQPNRRLQDGPKKYLLSSKAESQFSIREKWFAENIFMPYLKENKQEINYNENLFYFSVSLIWRALLLHIEDSDLSSQSFFPLLKSAENEWKLFLREYKFPIIHNRFYLFLTDRIKSHNIDSSGVDYYMTRTIDTTIVTNRDETFVAVYAKFLRFSFWCILKDGDEKKCDSRINPISGKLSTAQSFDNNEIESFYINRIKLIESLPEPSEIQQHKIINEMLKDKEGFLKSDAGQSIMNDRINLDPK